jgi:hypothetical protein
MTPRVRRVIAGGLALLALSGCGVSAEGSARTIQTPRGAHPGVNSAASGGPDAGTVVEKLFLIKGDTLVAVERRVRAEPSVDKLMRDLLAGPTGAEQESSLTSALLGTDVMTSVHVAHTTATVELAAAPAETGRTDEVLALAQIVCTLTARPEISGVLFTRDSQRTAVPRGDGSLSLGPFTAADYLNLLLG